MGAGRRGCPRAIDSARPPGTARGSRSAAWRASARATASRQRSSSTRRISGWSMRRTSRGTTGRISSRWRLASCVASSWITRARVARRSAAAPRRRVTFDEALVVTNEPREDFVALDDALEALAKFDERKSRVVELRFFGGLTVEETASVVEGVARNGDARLATGEGMAAARDARRSLTRPLSARGRRGAVRRSGRAGGSAAMVARGRSAHTTAARCPRNPRRNSCLPGLSAPRRPSTKPPIGSGRRYRCWSRCWCRRRIAASRPSHQSRCPPRHSSSPECHRPGCR